MGATLCNIYCRDDTIDALKANLNQDDKLLMGYNGWNIALAKDRDLQRMTQLAKSIDGDVLVFYYFDDDLFTLTLFKNGKQTAEIDSHGRGSKLSLIAELLPEDTSALKKLRAVKSCISIDEQVALLEETFGLPFYVLNEQEEVPLVEQGDKVWNTLIARVEKLRKRPNQFQIVQLTQDEWPDSTKDRMRLISNLRKQLPSFYFNRLFMDIASLKFTQPGKRSCILFPLYIQNPDEDSSSGYNTVLVVDYSQKKSAVFNFPFSIADPILFNSNNNTIVCETIKQKSVVCLDEEGLERWCFAPDLKFPQQLNYVRTDREEIILCSRYSQNTENYIWRISPLDGSILSERTIPIGEDTYSLRWLPDMKLFTYYELRKNELVLLDKDFNEVRRFHLGKDNIRFDIGFYAGSYGYVCIPLRDGNWKIFRLDLNSGEKKWITPEIPDNTEEVLPGEIFPIYAEKKGGTLYLLNHDGIVISQNSIKGAFYGLWEENGHIYGMTTKRSRFPGFWEDSILDSLSIFLLKQNL